MSTPTIEMLKPDLEGLSFDLDPKTNVILENARFAGLKLDRITGRVSTAALLVAFSEPPYDYNLSEILQRHNLTSKRVYDAVGGLVDRGDDRGVDVPPIRFDLPVRESIIEARKLRGSYGLILPLHLFGGLMDPRVRGFHTVALKNLGVDQEQLSSEVQNAIFRAKLL